MKIALRENDSIKIEIKNTEIYVEYTISKQWKHIVLTVWKILQTKVVVLFLSTIIHKIFETNCSFYVK